MNLTLKNDNSKLIELEEALEGSREQLEVSRAEFEKSDALMHASEKKNQEKVASLESSLSDAMQRLHTALEEVTCTQSTILRLRRENAQRLESERKQNEAAIHVADDHRAEQLLRLARKKRERRSNLCSRDSDDSDTSSSEYVATHCKTPKKKRSKHKRSSHDSYMSNCIDNKVKQTQRAKASSRKKRRRRRTSENSDTNSSSEHRKSIKRKKEKWRTVEDTDDSLDYKSFSHAYLEFIN